MAASPIQIVPLHTELATPVGTPQLTYRGGPLLSSVQVFVLFWGDAWSQQQALVPLVAQLGSFFDYVLTSSLMVQLAEYSVAGATIGHGSKIGAAHLTGAPPSSLTDADVRQMLQREIASGSSVPKPTASTLYFVFLPPGVTIGMDGGSSCVNFCGYHSDIAGSVFYAVMPYPDCSGCTGALPVLDALTSTSSHELCEAITDPVPGKGWYDDQNGEIGDICAWKTKRLGAYAVQLEWSNKAGRCI